MKVHEEKILRTLIKSKRKLTTSQIQEHTKFSWTTCRKSLDNLEKQELVKKEHLKTIIYWYIENG